MNNFNLTDKLENGGNISINTEKLIFSIENSSTPAAVLDEKGKIVYANSAVCLLTNYSREELISADYSKLGFSTSEEEFLNCQQWLFFNGNLKIESSLKRNNSSELDIILISYYISTSKGDYIVIFIEESKSDAISETQNKPNEFEKYFHLLADYLNEWEYWTNENGIIEYMTSSVKEVTGYTKEEFMADNSLLTKIIHPLDLSSYTAHSTYSFKGKNGSVFELDFRIIRKDGRIKWIKHNCRAIYDDGQKFTGVRVSNKDISITKGLEIALIEDQKLFTAGPVIVFKWLMSEEGWPVIYVSPNVESLWEYKREAFLSKEILFSSLIHPEDIDRVKSEIYESISKKYLFFEAEYRVRLADGSYKWHYDFTKINYSQLGGVESLRGYLLDIEKMKNSITELEYTKKILEQKDFNNQILLQLNKMLQSANNYNECLELIRDFVPQVFPDSSGQISMKNSDNGFFESIACWGDLCDHEKLIHEDRCIILKMDSPYIYMPDMPTIKCEYIKTNNSSPHICIPLISNRETMGKMHIRLSPSNLANAESDFIFAQSVAEIITLNIVNLNMRHMLFLQATRDPLTGVFNRRYLEEMLPRELGLATRRDQTFCIIMADIDHFKKVNDTFGHYTGDTILINVAEIIRHRLRQSDIVCRYGGEEFILLLSDTSTKEAYSVCEEIRHAVSKISLEDENGVTHNITISMGISEFPRDGTTTPSLIENADKALYSAKSNGRNKVKIFGD